MVEKELGEQAEVLGVDLVLAPVYLKHGDGRLPVDLVPGRVLNIGTLDDQEGQNHKVENERRWIRKRKDMEQDRNVECSERSEGEGIRETRTEVGVVT